MIIDCFKLMRVSQFRDMGLLGALLLLEFVFLTVKKFKIVLFCRLSNRYASLIELRTGWVIHPSLWFVTLSVYFNRKLF